MKTDKVSGLQGSAIPAGGGLDVQLGAALESHGNPAWDCLSGFEQLRLGLLEQLRTPAIWMVWLICDPWRVLFRVTVILKGTRARYRGF